jgi:hypothetical protein
MNGLIEVMLTNGAGLWIHHADISEAGKVALICAHDRRTLAAVVFDALDSLDDSEMIEATYFIDANYIDCDTWIFSIDELEFLQSVALDALLGVEF